jgi:hypothetical protein
MGRRITASQPKLQQTGLRQRVSGAILRISVWAKRTSTPICQRLKIERLALRQNMVS